MAMAMAQTGYVSPPPSPPWDADSIGISPLAPVDYSSLVPPPLATSTQNQNRTSLPGPPQRYLNSKRFSQGHPPPYRNRYNRASMQIQRQEQEQDEQMNNDIHPSNNYNDVYKYDKHTAPPRPKFHHICEADSKPLNSSKISTCSVSTQTTDSDIEKSTTEFQIRRKQSPPVFGTKGSAEYMDINQNRYYQPTTIERDQPDLSLAKSTHNKLTSITINVVSSENESLWSKTFPEVEQNRPIITGPSLEALRRGKAHNNKPVSINLLKRLGFKSRSRG